MNTTEFINNLRGYFNVTTDLRDVNFQSFTVKPYTFAETDRRFGEKNCLLYDTDFILYNIKFSMKILSLLYERHAEVLKLNILIHNDALQREMASCRNFLQRKRNLNLTFEMLIKFTELFESRRLICQTVCQRQSGVSVAAEESGTFIKCHRPDLQRNYLEICWNIVWNLENSEVYDLLEFCCNYKELENECWKKVKGILSALVEPNLNFNIKLKLWKSLITEIYKWDLLTRPNQPAVSTSSEVLEISDSDSDDDESVIFHYKKINDNCKNQAKDEILLID